LSFGNWLVEGAASVLTFVSVSWDRFSYSTSATSRYSRLSHRVLVAESLAKIAESVATTRALASYEHRQGRVHYSRSYRWRVEPQPMPYGSFGAGRTVTAVGHHHHAQVFVNFQCENGGSIVIEQSAPWPNQGPSS
jgi:hypothetical protein